MEEYETDYDQEVSEDPDGTEQEDGVTGLEEIDQEETGTDLDGTEQEEADPEEDLEEEAGEEQSGTETDGTAEDQEEEAGDGPVEGQEEAETVSGNDIVIKGDVVVFPEGYESLMSESESTLADAEAIVKAIEAQSDNMTAGFACTCFMLGVLAGAMIIAGFRLRRV